MSKVTNIEDFLPKRENLKPITCRFTDEDWTRIEALAERYDMKPIPMVNVLVQFALKQIDG